jgi:hypothetical protein
MWRLGFSGFLLVANFWPVMADAQTMSTGNERSKAYKNMATACVADTARFCPNVGRSAVARREQFICLKVYHADLALPCRKAVNAVSPIPPVGGDHS